MSETSVPCGGQRERERKVAHREEGRNMAEKKEGAKEEKNHRNRAKPIGVYLALALVLNQRLTGEQIHRA